MNQKEGYPAVTRIGGSSMKVCVPSDWGDVKVLAFAEQENPCSTVDGWLIRRPEHMPLDTGPERTQCEQFDSHCHIMLDA